MSKLNDLLSRIITKVNDTATKGDISQLSEAMAYKVTSPSVAEVGQVIAVKAVDENGKPTEWEAVDMAAGGGSAVQPDWNQSDETAADFIKNRPFGDVTIHSDTFTWDGNTEGLLSIDLGGVSLYKISDIEVNAVDAANGGSVVVGDVISRTLVCNSLMTGLASLLDDVNYDAFFVLVTQDGVGVDLGGLSFPESGIYVNSALGVGISLRLTINGYTGFVTNGIKTIDEKYLPASIPSERMPKPVILYYGSSDSDYLYSNKEDVGAETKRITKQYLRSVMYDRVFLHNADSPSEGISIPDEIVIWDDYAYDYGQVVKYADNGRRYWYTAEYVTPTT